MLKKDIFHVLNEKKIDLIHMLDPIQYEFRFFQHTLADPEPEPGARAGSKSRSRNFDISAPAPAPAKSFGSGRLWLCNPGSLCPWVVLFPVLVIQRLANQRLVVQHPVKLRSDVVC